MNPDRSPRSLSVRLLDHRGNHCWEIVDETFQVRRTGSEISEMQQNVCVIDESNDGRTLVALCDRYGLSLDGLGCRARGCVLCNLQAAERTEEKNQV